MELSKGKRHTEQTVGCSYVDPLAVDSLSRLKTFTPHNRMGFVLRDAVNEARVRHRDESDVAEDRLWLPDPRYDEGSMEKVSRNVEFTSRLGLLFLYSRNRNMRPHSKN